MFVCMCVCVCVCVCVHVQVPTDWGIVVRTVGGRQYGRGAGGFVLKQWAVNDVAPGIPQRGADQRVLHLIKDSKQAQYDGNHSRAKHTCTELSELVRIQHTTGARSIHLRPKRHSNTSWVSCTTCTCTTHMETTKQHGTTTDTEGHMAVIPVIITDVCPTDSLTVPGKNAHSIAVEALYKSMAPVQTWASYSLPLSSLLWVTRLVMLSCDFYVWIVDKGTGEL